MPQVQLDNQVFEAARRKAADGGYSSIDEYVADIVVQDLVEGTVGETPNLDDRFTPQRLAEIERAAADVKAGNYFTSDQVREHFKQKRAAWNQANVGR